MNKWYIWDYNDFMNGSITVANSWKNYVRGMDNPKYFIAQDDVSNDNLTIAINWVRENLGEHHIYGDRGLTSFILETDEELMAFKLAIM